MVKIDDYILYQDERVNAINKPSGLLSIPDRSGSEGSLKQLLQKQSEKIFTVHRLDKETSGVIVFAKTEEAHKYFSQQFETRETKKIYNGLVIGIPAIIAGTINEPLAEHPRKKGMMTIYRKGKESITEYKLI